MKRPVGIVVLILVMGLVYVAPASAGKRAGRSTITVETVTIENPENPEEPMVEVRGLIDPHGLPTRYEVWMVEPEFFCEDLEGCPHYAPEVIKTGSIAATQTVVFRDEIQPQYREEVWFMARNADGKTKSRHVKLSPCHRRYCRT